MIKIPVFYSRDKQRALVPLFAGLVEDGDGDWRFFSFGGDRDFMCYQAQASGGSLWRCGKRSGKDAEAWLLATNTDGEEGGS